MNTGNTRTWQLTAGSDLSIARMPHEIGGSIVFNYGQAALRDDEGDQLQTTIRNLRTRARYDYFLARMDALFTAAAFRWDTFAGIDARVQGELGYLRYLYKTDDHRVWTELGYDFTYDDYHVLPDAPRATPPNQVTHSARVFFGYDNRLTEVLTYLGGIEGLLNVEFARDTRVNMDNALRSHVGGNFALELKFSLQFDNIPVPGARKLDTQTVASLIYTLI
jgi:putative salt-induced outer membrane protein YdiY